MIFVTVGTHEQPFDRLIEYMDNWSALNDEEIIIQTGYSNYIPKNCRWQTLFSYNDMKKNVQDARLIITHGGPSSFIMPLQIGKIPIVVPRRKEFGEHVNDHQVEFAHAVSERMKNIIVIDDIENLSETIQNYNEMVIDMKKDNGSNNEYFCVEFDKIVNSMVKK